MNPIPTKFAGAGLIIALLLFFGLSGYQLSLPGLHYDEAFEAVPAVQLLHGQTVTAFRDSTLTLFGQAFPLTTQDYIGALNTYGSWPFIALGGSTALSLRLYALLIAGLTLGVVYGFTTSLNRSRWAGVVAVLLLAVNPTFIFWSRQGIFVTAINAGLGVAAAWAWLGWWRTRRYSLALLGAFLMGLGLYAKLLFLWLIVALGGALALSLLQRAWQTRPVSLKDGFSTLIASLWERLSVGKVAGLITAGAVGAWPLLVYNWQTAGTWRSITENAGVSYYGVDNADVFSNLLTRFEQVIVLLNGSHFWYLGQVHSNWLAPAIFGVAVGVALWLTWQHQNRVVWLPFVVLIFVTGQSIVTVSALWVTHFAVVMVWPSIAVATVAVQWSRRPVTAPVPQKPRRLQLPRLGGVVVMTLLLGLWGSDLATTMRYHQSLSHTGGLSDHSDAIYDLAEWLVVNAKGPVVAMDWGLAASVYYLTAGEVAPVEVFGYGWQESADLDEVLAPYLTAESGAVFLWRAPDETIFDRSARFKALYRPLNLEEDILAAFYEESGRPLYGVTHLVPLGAAENAPVE